MSMAKSFGSAVATLGLFAAAPGGARADFVDSFDAENGGNPAFNHAGLANFDITAGSVDLIGNGVFDVYPGNGLYLDLNGTTGTSGTITSRATFGPGAYRLAFALGNNAAVGGPNSVTVTLGAYSETFTRVGRVDLEWITRPIVLDSSGRLTFSTPARDGDYSGIVIDDVRLVRSAGVPEPASLAMLGAGGLGLLGYARRRKVRATA
jgi:hypothetical protein